MYRPNNLTQTLNNANQVLNLIITQALQQIKINSFAQRNQPTFIIQTQQNIFNSNLKHLLEKPLHSLTYLESQPKKIPEDNFMNTGIQEKSNSVSQSKEKVSVKLSSGRYTIKSTLKQDYSSRPLRNKIKQAFKSKLQVLFKQNQVKEQQDFYLQQLRNLKIEQEKAANAGKSKIKPKPVCNLGKDEEIMFDYQGNFCKRKESPKKEFESINVEGAPIKHQKQIQPKQKLSIENTTNVEILNRSRNKSQISKLISSQQSEYKQKLFQSSNKEEFIDQIQIKYSGIKLIIDGNPIKKKDNFESNFQDVRIDPKSVMLKKVKESLRERFKTQNVADLQIITKFKRKEANSKKSRVVTQFNQTLAPKSGKISIQNHSLHSFVIHNQQEIENRYTQLPSKQSFQRIMKTNVQKSSRITSQYSKLKERSTSLMKQKDRSASLMKQRNHLPKILSTKQHHQIQAQVFRQFRDKCKEF